MATDVARFEAAIDKVYKTAATQEVQLEAKAMKGLGDREAKQYIEQKFQQHLQRARAAFLQEFRNHSVVVASEVKRIREELTEKFEVMYGERISQFKAEAVEATATIAKLREEILQLKSLVGAQESYLVAVRHRWGLENRDKLRAEIAQLKEELERARQENADLGHQMMCRDELVAQLNQELGGMEDRLRNQASLYADERLHQDDLILGLRQDMQAMQEQFRGHLNAYEQQFEEYRAKTSIELQVQDILNQRRTEALQSMEEERQLHIQARTKPTPRIGEDPQLEARCEDYPLAEAKYRVDDMGMDTSWRDYELNALQLVPLPARKVPQPRFRVERLRQAAQRANVGGVHAPTATDTPREAPPPPPRATLTMRQMTPPLAALGATAATTTT